MFLSFISWKKIILKVIPTISFLCAFIVIAVVWTLLFFNIENDFYNYSYRSWCERGFRLMIHWATFWAMLPSTGNQARHRAHDQSRQKCVTHSQWENAQATLFKKKLPSKIAQNVAPCIINIKKQLHLNDAICCNIVSHQYLHLHKY